MTIEPNDFQSRMRILLGLRGAVLTDEELSHTEECYARCRGKGDWDVREYVRRTGLARANTGWYGGAAAKTCTAASSGRRRPPWGPR